MVDNILIMLKALASSWNAEEVTENYRISVEAIYEMLKHTLETLKKVKVIAAEITN